MDIGKPILNTGVFLITRIFTCKEEVSEQLMVTQNKFHQGLDRDVGYTRLLVLTALRWLTNP